MKVTLVKCILISRERVFRSKTPRPSLGQSSAWKLPAWEHWELSVVLISSALHNLGNTRSALCLRHPSGVWTAASISVEAWAATSGQTLPPPCPFPACQFSLSVNLVEEGLTQNHMMGLRFSYPYSRPCRVRMGEWMVIHILHLSERSARIQL